MPRGMMVVTDGKMIAAWRARETEGYSSEEISKKYKVTARTITKWIRTVNNDPKLLAAAKSHNKYSTSINNISEQHTSAKPTAAPKTIKKADTSKQLLYVVQLEDEVAFMRWWNTGERKGYVERLLNKLQED